MNMPNLLRLSTYGRTLMHMSEGIRPQTDDGQLSRIVNGKDKGFSLSDKTLHEPSKCQLVCHSNPPGVFDLVDVTYENYQDDWRRL